MDCLKSFSLNLTGNINGTGITFYAWGTAGDYNWLYETTGLQSTFIPQGFKNINIYKIEQVGFLQSGRSANSSLINDWSFFIRLNGQNPVPTGNILATNDFGLVSQFTPLIALGKYNTSFEFINPITSVSSIVVERLEANGIGNISGSAVYIEWNVTLIVYYTFEGE